MFYSHRSGSIRLLEEDQVVPEKSLHLYSISAPMQYVDLISENLSKFLSSSHEMAVLIEC